MSEFLVFYLDNLIYVLALPLINEVSDWLKERRYWKMVCARRGEAFSLLLAEMRCTSSRSLLQISSSKYDIEGTDFKASSAIKGTRLISFTTIIFIADGHKSQVVSNVSPCARGMVEETQSLATIPSNKDVGGCRPPKTNEGVVQHNEVALSKNPNVST